MIFFGPLDDMSDEDLDKLIDAGDDGSSNCAGSH